MITENQKESKRKWANSNKEYFKNYRKNNKDRDKARYTLNRNIILKTMQKRNQERRLFALKYLSGEIPFCACCGEKHLEFLSIDHINGGGNKHRKEMVNQGGSGGNIYWWLIKNDFPPGFQVLCHNCNMAKGFYGHCPHQKSPFVL